MTEAELVRRVSDAFSKGVGCLFVGAGVSAGSGLPNWEKALAELTKERLAIEIGPSDNFPLLAQYIVNKDMGNRGALISSLKSIFHRQLRQNQSHHAISLMNVRTIWTTNYDTLLEEAFAGSHTAVRVNDDGITWPIPSADIEIVKMHGCIDRSRHEDIVITQEDYEDYLIRRPATVQRLQQDIITKSFLIVGYSFRDPNIASLFTIARRLKSSATHPHYMIAKRGTEPDPRVASWHEDLRRVGIHVVEVDDYGRIPKILLSIAKNRSAGPFTSPARTKTLDQRSVRFALMWAVVLPSCTRMEGRTSWSHLFLWTGNRPAAVEKSSQHSSIRLLITASISGSTFISILIRTPQIRTSPTMHLCSLCSSRCVPH